MRIKKTSQTTPVQAQIVDGYSTSTTDGYSANYVNEILLNKAEAQILWENPNKADAFSEQDVTLNSDDYDIIGWVIRLGTTNNNTDILFTIKGFGGRYYYGTQQRQFNRTSNTKYHVTGGTSATSEAVPIYAIGFKFGLNL